jgi:hypothetical protein
MAPSNRTAELPEAVKASPYAFTVGGEVFFDPHSGPCCWCGNPACTDTQLRILQKISRRIRTGEGPSNYFLRGKRGGGKSVLCRKGLLHAMAMAFEGLKYAVVRRNMPDLRSNHLIYLGGEMRRLGGTYHETHGICHYPKGSLGFYRQCEEEADVEKIVGAEVAVLFVDEAPQIKWDYLRMIGPSLRVPRGVDGTQPYFIATIYGGNPIGESIEELDRYFIDKDITPEEDPEYDPNDWEHIEIGLEDNPSLDPVEYRKQFSGLPAHYLAAWRDGVRVESRTLFQVHKTKNGQPYHYIQELPTIGTVPLLRVPWIEVSRAFDMGFFPDPAYALWLAVVGRRIIAVRERVWFSTIAKDIAASLIEETKELIGETPVTMTYVDPGIAMKDGQTVTIMDVLEMAGVPCEPSINDRVLYADAIHGLLGEEVEPGVPRFQIYEPGCPLLAKYLPKMRWDEKNPRKMADHKFDHPAVTLAYFAISSGVLSVSRETTSGPAEPVWMGWIREAQQGRRGRAR